MSPFKRQEEGFRLISPPANPDIRKYERPLAGTLLGLTLKNAQRYGNIALII